MRIQNSFSSHNDKEKINRGKHFKSIRKISKCKKTDRSTLDINDNSEIYYSSEVVGDESLDGDILDKLSQT